MPEKSLGFVGLGRVGGPMSGRLIDAGYELTVYDPSAPALDAAVARGARRAGSPREVADAAPIVLTSLPTPDVVLQVALGTDGLAGGSAIEVILDLSTTGPNAARRAAAGLAEHDVQWVDCPVSGGVTGAASGTLAVMASCPRVTYDRIEPVIATFGKRFFVGEQPGLAQVVKLGNNMLAAAALVLSSEALAMA